MRQTDLATTCDQLASLLHSGLPLPESLRELAATSPARSRCALQRLASETNNGQSLADAMAGDDAFDAPSVALIRAGEASDSLPEMLSELADIAWQRQRTVEQLRQIVAYPMIVCYLALVLYCLLQAMITPTLKTAFADIDGVTIQAATALTFAASDSIAAQWPLIVVGLAITGAVGVWVLVGGGAAAKLLAAGIQWLPGGRNVLRTLDLGRSCRYLASLLGRKATMHDAMYSAAGIVFDQKWRRCLEDWAKRHQDGTPLADLVTTGSVPDRLLATAFAEDAAPAEAFGQLAEVYERRAEYAAARWRTLWQVAASVFMFVAVGTTVISLFQPLVTMLNAIGGVQ